jgi:uncharacterized protein YkwD
MRFGDILLRIAMFDKTEFIIKTNYIIVISLFVLVGCGSNEIGPSKTMSTTSSQSAATGTTNVQDMTLQAVIPKAAYAGGSQELAAFNFINARRGACGFGQLKQDTRLDAAAFAHARYVATPSAAALSHVEVKSIAPDLFTGINPSDRALAQGYPVALPYFDEDFGAGTLIEANFAEVLASDLMNAPLHLLSLLRPNRDIGVGVYSAERGANSLPFRAVVLKMSTTAGTQEPIGIQTFPCAGSEVPGAFYGNEIPDPFPGRNYALNPMGSPLAIVARTGSQLVLTTYSLRKTGDSRELALNLLSAANRGMNIRSSEVVLIPELPLAAASTFEVKLSGTLNGAPWVKEFSFTASK